MDRPTLHRRTLDPTTHRTRRRSAPTQPNSPHQPTDRRRSRRTPRRIQSSTTLLHHLAATTHQLTPRPAHHLPLRPRPQQHTTTHTTTRQTTLVEPTPRRPQQHTRQPNHRARRRQKNVQQTRPGPRRRLRLARLMDQQHQTPPRPRPANNITRPIPLAAVRLTPKSKTQTTIAPLTHHHRPRRSLRARRRCQPHRPDARSEAEPSACSQNRTGSRYPHRPHHHRPRRSD